MEYLWGCPVCHLVPCGASRSSLSWSSWRRPAFPPPRGWKWQTAAPDHEVFISNGMPLPCCHLRCIDSPTCHNSLFLSHHLVVACIGCACVGTAAVLEMQQDIEGSETPQGLGNSGSPQLFGSPLNGAKAAKPAQCCLGCVFRCYRTVLSFVCQGELRPGKTSLTPSLPAWHDYLKFALGLGKVALACRGHFVAYHGTCHALE